MYKARFLDNCSIEEKKLLNTLVNSFEEMCEMESERIKGLNFAFWNLEIPSWSRGIEVMCNAAENG